MKKTQSRTRTANPQFIRERVSEIAKQATDLCQQNEFTERDLARAVELNQQYVDLLEEIERAPVVVSASVIVGVAGSHIKFDGIDKVAEWITSL